MVMVGVSGFRGYGYGVRIGADVDIHGCRAVGPEVGDFCVRHVLVSRADLLG